MARLPRIVVPNQPLHIMHRGNNRQAIFESEEDLIRMKEDVEHSLLKSGCSLHAYVIMTNHLHFLVTPKDKGQLAVFMQSMANRYVRYYNAKNKRTGTIWEGRFKSCLVDSEHYLFALYKYIEMNPVRAGMVKEPADYKWSSYDYNALGKVDRLISEHSLYKTLGKDLLQRCKSYQKIFNKLDIAKEESLIMEATSRGEVFGTNGFHQKISQMISRSTKLAAHGGDRKSEAYKNQVG